MGIVANTTTVSLLQVANAFMRVCNSSNIVTTGSGSITVPSYARGVVVIAVGAGGGGNTVYGGSGGATLYLHRLVTSGQTINYNVGTGGTATTVGSGVGGDGSSTNVTIGGVTFEASGGQGGQIFTSGGTTAQSDLWTIYSAAETNAGTSGEIDGTAGLPGLQQENLYAGGLTGDGYTFGSPSQGEGGTGTPSPSNGGDGTIIFKWLSCPLQTDVYTSGTSQTITSPTDADFVVIKAWGGGGGGKNNPGPTGGPGGGGGGGAFTIKRMPVTGGSTQFTYTVGAGGSGDGGNGGNTIITGATTLYANGGFGGTLGSGGSGGDTSGGDIDSDNGTAGDNVLGLRGYPGRYNTLNIRDRHYYQPVLKYSGLANTEPLWDAVTNSGTPGQGGDGDFEGSGDPGANGEIRFEWFTSKPRLSKFRANATITTGFTEKADIPTTPNNAAGYNGMIVESGNIDLLDFRDATFVNHMLSSYTSSAAHVTYASAAAYGRAELKFSNTGIMTVSLPDGAASNGEYPDSLDVAWLMRGSNTCNFNTTDAFDVRVTKQGGADPIEGLANNTWFNVDQERNWYVSADAPSPSSPPGGFASNTCNVLVEFRRADSNAAITSFSVVLLATAQSNSGPPP